MAAGDVTKALRNAVRARIGPASTLGFTDAQIYSYLSYSQHDIAWRVPDAALNELTSVASGNLAGSSFTVPTDFLRERLVKVGTTGVVAGRVSVAEQKSISALEPTATNPFYYLWYDGSTVKFRLFVGNDVSTLAYTLMYVAAPTAVDASTDPLLNTGLHGLMVQFAVRRCRELRGEYDLAQVELAAYLASVSVVAFRYGHTKRNDGAPGDPAVMK